MGDSRFSDEDRKRIFEAYEQWKVITLCATPSELSKEWFHRQLNSIGELDRAMEAIERSEYCWLAEYEISDKPVILFKTRISNN